MKKLVSICLILFMLCGLMVGCGDSSGGQSKDDPNEVVTLKMALPGAKQKDADKVLTEINKQLETLLPNTKLEIMWEPDLATRWQLLMATKEPIDLAHSGYATDIESEVSKASYLELDTLVEEYAPNIKESAEKYGYSYSTGKVNGKLYAIPNVQTHVNSLIGIVLGTGMEPYIDVQALITEGTSTSTTGEKFWAIIDQGFDKAAADGYKVKGSIHLGWYEIAKKGYTFIGGSDSNICYATSGSPEIVDFYETEAYQAYCKYMKIWANKGYVSMDALDQGLRTYGYKKVNPFYIDETTGEYYNVADTAAGHLVIPVENVKSKIFKSETGEVQTYWSIPFTSEHPARAMRFLDLLHSEEGRVITNLLAFGIEGKHYEFTNKEKGEIHAFEYQGQGGSNVSYGVPHWMVANMLEGMYSVAPYTDEYTTYAKQYYEELEDKGNIHPLNGFTYELSNIKVPLSNILKNNAELAANHYSGILPNGDAFYAELMDKNKAAGISDVIDELQSQVDKYLASQE